MNEEIKNKPVELTDDEMKNAAGGSELVPHGYVKCKVVFADYMERYNYCMNVCGFKIHCAFCSFGSFHSPEYSDAEIQAAYDKWKKRS